MNEIIRLIRDLLEHRASNRRIVLDECVKPLEVRFESIHLD